jgi:hypothetical protein
MKIIILWSAIALIGGPLGWWNQSNGERLSRQRIESILGEPCTHIVPPKGLTCYEVKNGSVRIYVEYDDADNVRTLSINACMEPFEELDKIAAKLIPEGSRGDYLGCREEAPGPDCRERYAKDYDQLTMHYSWDTCYGCTHPAIVITWKPKR